MTIEQQILIDEWRGLYKESWKGLIHNDAFAHPAKFSRALIRKIYDHVTAEGWTNRGDLVVDPFGGVALGAFEAMRHGLNFVGVELEAKFVDLGNKNIELWNERFSRMPNWGRARLVQGDSRKLAEVLSAAECCVSSPPYAGNEKSDYLVSDDGKTRRRDEKRGFRQGHGCFRGSEGAYGSSEGQLGVMKEGDHSIAISSPPYIDSVNANRSGINWDKAKRPERWTGSRERKGCQAAASHEMKYGETEGQLGAMPEGQLAITSPPFENSLSLDRPNAAERRGVARERGISNVEHISPIEMEKLGKRHEGDYGATEGNLGNMRGGFDAAISSPPFLDQGRDDRQPQGGMKVDIAHRKKGDNGSPPGLSHFGETEGQIGVMPAETFWSASRQILEQLHQVIVPGGHAVFVTKRFVRDKQIVDFTDQWIQLCEAVGFRLLHHHRAMLVEDYGTQGGFETDKRITIARKSFFRRLAESKNSPAIDWEDVTCLIRNV